ncbi:hypothetical protein C4K02_0910 [Pseudomonas synxantha]|nr:hypothetical protein C4K02_0910 [Pseudomonas synxantha]
MQMSYFVSMSFWRAVYYESSKLATQIAEAPGTTLNED